MGKGLKLYYNIREVAEEIGVPEHTLRFWEKEIPTLKPKKPHRFKTNFMIFPKAIYISPKLCYNDPVTQTEYRYQGYFLS